MRQKLPVNRVNVYPEECFGGRFTFSGHLINEEWTRKDEYAERVVENVAWEQARGNGISWDRCLLGGQATLQSGWIEQ